MNLPTSPDLAMIALSDAKKSNYEAPWYGFYGLVLSPLSRSKGATLMYPQLPVRFQESVGMESDSDQSEGESESEDMPESPIYISGAKRQLETNQVTPGHNDMPAEGTSSNEHKPTKPGILVSAKEYKKLRSERTPDFCRRRYYLDDKGKVFAARVDLLVEIKKEVNTGNSREIEMTILRQIFTQAEHAFGEDPRLTKIICMGAIGPRWFYFLAKRPSSTDKLKKVLRKYSHPRLAQADSPYVPSDQESLSVTPASTTHEFSSPDELGSSFNPTFPDTPKRDFDTSLGTVKRVLFPSMLDAGIFKDPSSAKEKKWIIKLRKKLDEIDEDIAESYRKQLREEDDESDDKIGQGDDESADKLGQGEDKLHDEEEDGELDDELGEEGSEPDNGLTEEDDESDGESRDEIDFLSKKTSGEKGGGGEKDDDNDESEDELDFWGKGK